MIEQSGTGEPQSPWWYRRRSAVYGILYFAGFFIGGLTVGLLHSGYVPTFAAIGLRFDGEMGVSIMQAVMALLMLLAFLLRFWGSSYLQPSIVWNADAKAETLFVEGPFRYTRNPLYLGNMFMSLGIGLLATPIGLAIIVIASTIFQNALINHEEVLLRARFGDAYARYCATVPRFWPRLSPAPASGAALQPSFAQGLRSEVFSLALFLAVCALFLGRPYGVRAFFAIYIGGIIAQRLIVRGGTT